MIEMHYAGRFDDRAARLDYYLLADGKCLSYGIAIEQRLADQPPEREESYFFTRDRAEAEEILKRLVRGTVTPMTLCCILDDILSDREYREAAPSRRDREYAPTHPARDSAPPQPAQDSAPTHSAQGGASPQRDRETLLALV